MVGDMDSRLKIKLYNGWRLVENEGVLASYVKGASCLQFSHAHKKGSPLQDDPEQLISICEKLTQRMRGSRDMSSASGKCAFGIFGTVVAKGDYPAHFQAWVLKNENDLILITQTCETEPSPQEITEAGAIALMTKLGTADGPVAEPRLM
jgi:hypothetical protein